MKLVVVLLAAGCASSTNPLFGTPQRPSDVETPESAIDTSSQRTHNEMTPPPDAWSGEHQTGQIEQTHLGSQQHATETERITPPQSSPAPPAAQHLLVATSAVVAAPPEVTRLTGALERLADAVALVAPSRTDDIARIRESASTLELSGTDAGSHSAEVRAALGAAGHALRSLPIDLTTSYGVRLRDAADEVVQKADSIDPAAPLDKQYAPVREALRASTDAVYSALHEPPPVLPGQA
jgi:hypothetical protein